MKFTAEILPKLIMILTRTVVCAAILVGAGVIVTVLIRTAPEPPMRPADDGMVTVAVFELNPMAVRRSWSAIGTVRAQDSATISAEVTAMVKRTPELRAGDRVSRGQVLVELDDSDFRFNRDMAVNRIAEIERLKEQVEMERRALEAQIELEVENVAVNERNLERVEGLMARGASSQQDVDAATQALVAARLNEARLRERLSLIPSRLATLEVQHKSARHSRDLAELNLRRCRIVSPLDGVLQMLDAEVGLQLQPGQVIARVVDPTRLEVPLRLPAASRSELKVGDHVVLRHEHHPDHTWTSRVTRIEPEDDVRSRTVTAWTVLPRVTSDQSEPDSQTAVSLSPRVFVTATVQTGELYERWVVPRRSVRDGRMMTVEAGRLRSVPVTVAFSLESRPADSELPDEQWLVLEHHSGLERGTPTLIHASATFVDGQRVRPMLHHEINGRPVSIEQEN